MFSQLGPLFKAQFRRTESNDTRQYIPHEERDKNRKKDEEQTQKKPDSSAWTDNASVSVLALRAFLIDFLKTIPGNEDYNFINDRGGNQELPTRPKQTKRPTSTYSAKAVRAYQTMATHAPKNTSHHVTKTKLPKNNRPTADKLPPKEIREIHELITDLDELERKNIQTLNILKAENFVEGMKQAIKKAL